MAMIYKIIWRKEDYREGWCPMTNLNQLVSIENMKARWEVVHEYKHWFVSEAVPTHDYIETHLIIWHKNNSYLRNASASERRSWSVKLLPSHARELSDIIEEHSCVWFTAWRSSSEDQSIPEVNHYHLAIFKDMDNKIDKPNRRWMRLILWGLWFFTLLQAFEWVRTILL